MVPDTSAARLSMMISLPSEAMSFTGSIEDCARAEAAAARTMFCMEGMGTSMAVAGSSTEKTATHEARQLMFASSLHATRDRDLVLANLEKAADEVASTGTLGSARSCYGHTGFSTPTGI